MHILILTLPAEISETAYTVTIRLDVANEAGEETDPPTILLNVEYPKAYPDVGPILEITAPEDEESHRLFNLDNDKDRLVKALETGVEENMGMPMIFTLVSTVKEAAEEIIHERQEVEKQAHITRVMAIEAEENKKFHGTKVTRETFMKWRNAYRKELDEKEEAEHEEEREAEIKKNRGKVAEVKLTGRQLWERGLAGKGGDDEGQYDDAPVEQMQKVRV